MTTQDNAVLRAQVYKERKRRRWTQEDVAERAGVALRTVQAFESGKSWPQRAKLAAILRVLDIPMTDEGDPTSRWSADVGVFLDVIGVYLEGLSDDDRAWFIREETRRIFTLMRQSRGLLSAEEEDAARAAMRAEEDRQERANEPRREAL